MKFTLSWLKDHHETSASVAEIAEAMTMVGMEVEHVDDPHRRFAAFSVARVVAAAQHPNADRLSVCQVETKDGPKRDRLRRAERAGGAPDRLRPDRDLHPGHGHHAGAPGRARRGRLQRHALFGGRARDRRSESDGIIELAGSPAVGSSAAEALGLEAVIDFEVTPNRPDWLGVAGIARHLAAAGLGKLKDLAVKPVKGAFPCPVEIRLDGSDACPAFAGRLIRGVKNGPSPAWLQARLRAVGHAPSRRWSISPT